MKEIQVIKRDGKVVQYDRQKIMIAVQKAWLDVEGEVPAEHIPENIAKSVENYIEFKGLDTIDVEKIQDLVEDFLIEGPNPEVAKAYIRYRHKRELVRKSNSTDKAIKELLEGTNEYWNTENSNKNPKRSTVQRDYMAGIVSTDITKRFLLDEDIVKAHEEGIIHFHDADYFAQNAIHNCELINLEDMLQNGTIINEVMIERPHRLLTATTIATQIITAVTSSSYGGATISLTHLAPFVRESKKELYKKYSNRGLTNDQIERFVSEDLHKEIVDSVQTFNYQVNSMTNTNGQAPFLTVFMYLGESKEYQEEIAMLTEEFLNQRILGVKNKKGVYITPAFPKLIYVLEEDNIHSDSKYWYLTELAAKCTAKRLVPDYISEKIMLKLKGDCYPCMGCRSFLTPDPINHKYYGRFNQGVVTINLADVAYSSKRNFDEFWKIFEERLELCHRALQIRHKRLSNVVENVSPILWHDGALARLKDGESIHELLHNNYSTISLGYAALYECVKYMTGSSHTGLGKDFGLQVMKKMNDKCAQWRAEENISYSVYGTPIESTTYKFAKSLKKRFGEDIFIKLDGRDRDYITNSYHVPVFEEIDAFTKLAFEAEFQELSPGGAISYIETPNLQNNIAAVEEVMKFIYDNIMYAELNTKSDYCQKCGYDGEILIDDNLKWYCPNCGNNDQEFLNVARRTCGYIGSQFWNTGRTNEIKDRVLHL